MKVSIVVSTYGDQRWAELAERRALPSTNGQGAHEILFTHDPNGTIALARNAGAARATGDFLIFLDADDELGEGYVDAMLAAIAQVTNPEAHLFTPAVSYVEASGRRQPPKFWPVVPYQDANWMVVGTMIYREMFEALGGFRNYGDPPGSNAYEDWGLWALAQREGCSVVKVPDAVYVAWVDSGSRHRGSDHATRVRWHYEIGHDLFPDRYPEGWIDQYGQGGRRRATARGRTR